MVYKIMNVNSIDAEMTQKYFPMLSEMRQQKIREMATAHERAVVFSAEILARQCLSEVFDAPEFSFSVLCNPNSLSLVGNFGGNICIVSKGDYVACVADTEKVGISLIPVEPFTFNDAQNNFTDSEIRYIFAESVYSFAQLVNMPQCNEEAVISRFAQMFALKEAQFKASGRGIRENYKKNEFFVNGKNITCSDPDYSVLESEKVNEANFFLGIVKKNS